MNKLFMFLTCRHFFTLFFFLCLCENLWHGLWEMENKSLNPVCVNNRNVFSWSHICNCYVGQTADGRIVNIPTSSPDRLSMPCLRWGTCCCKGVLWRGSQGTMVVLDLAPVRSLFWAAAFFLCSLALLASFTLGPISHVLPLGCRLFFLARGAATGLGATAPGADVSAASWAAWPGWLQPRHTLSPEHHLLCLPILLLQQPLGRSRLVQVMEMEG